MQLIMNTTYKDGAFIPDRGLGKENEGKKFKVYIIEEVASEAGKISFFRFVDNHSFDLPDDFKFSREEIYER